MAFQRHIRNCCNMFMFSLKIGGGKCWYHVVEANTFWTVALSICGSSTRSLVYVALLAPIISRCLIDFWKTYTPLL